MSGFFLTSACLALSTMVASAAPSVTSAPQETNFLNIISKGGFMMYPLGIMSVITVVLILIFLLTVRRNAIVSDRFMDAVDSMVRKRDYSGLSALSQRRNECMARITQKTLDFMTGNPTAPYETIRDVAQLEGSHQAGMLTSRITYLADIGGIAPIIGLLGTVIGMVKAFLEISAGEVGGVKQMGLAEGVSEALIATAGGLAVSIPALIFYSIFRGRVQKYVSELEAAATHFVALLQAQLERQSSQQRFRGEEDSPPPLRSPLAGERRDIQGI